MRALVTGAAGFIGSHITDALVGGGAEVSVIDSLETGSIANLSDYPIKRGVYQALQNIPLQSLIEIVESVDVIFHQAALGSVPRSIITPARTFDNNVVAFVHLLEAVRRSYNKPRVVFASSSSVYGDVPTSLKVESTTGNAVSPYAASKQAKEIYGRIYARTFNLRVVALRYFNVFGARQRVGEYAAVIPTWIEAMVKNEQVVINGDGNTARDFTPVRRVVTANLCAASATLYKHFDEFNVSGGNLITLNDLFKVLARITSYKKSPVYVEERKGDIRGSVGDQEKIQKHLAVGGKLSLNDLNDCLEETVRYYRSQMELAKESESHGRPKSTESRAADYH